MSLSNDFVAAQVRIAKEAEWRTGSLSLRDLRLDALPKELASLTKLQQLNCSGTQVSDLAPIAALTNLQQLNCSGTQVSDLAPIAALTNLQQLDCSECRLKALPTFLWQRHRLSLHAFNTHIPGLPAGILSQNHSDDCFARMRAHFADLAEETAELLDVKLLLLGNGCSGKTQIARRLRGELFESEWNSTHGVLITPATLPNRDGTPGVHLQIWDFGGQDIYHGTHALFVRA